ncbi:MAG: MFS transporter, partial [Dehalococcoidales bacterium]|nr:MFS transporter [Dehalococcoidales bacterium]
MIKKVFPILAVCLFSSTLGMGIVAPLLPLYLKDMGATGIWLGIIIAAYFISNSVAVPIVGRLSDRKGRKIFLTVGLLTYSIISLGYLWSGNVTLLALLRFVQGIAEAATIPVSLAYIGDLSPEGEEGKWMGYANAAFFSGFGLGPLLGGVMAEHFGMTATFLSMSGLNLFAFFIALLFLPGTNPRKAIMDSHLSFKEMSLSTMVRGLFSSRLGQSLGVGGFVTFLPLFAAMIGLRTSLIGTLLSVNILAMTLFAPLVGILADRFSRRTLTILGYLLAAVLLAVIPLTTSFWQLLAVLLVQGLSSAIALSASSALTVEEGRKFGMGSTTSILFMAGSIGMAFGPIISGGIAEVLNIDLVFYFG